MVSGVDEVINMACNMGGMGFIENNKALCMLSVLVNTHLLMACKEFKVKKYFFSSSACAYNKDPQNETGITGLKEDAPSTEAFQKMVMAGKNYLVKVCRHFLEDYNHDIGVIRRYIIFLDQMVLTMVEEKRLS